MYFNGRWSDMDQEQQRAAKEQFGSRDAWMTAKEKNRMAGDKVVENPEAVKPTPTPSKVSNINNYDTTSYGAGANRDADRLSGSDIRELDKQGFSSQEIVDYAENKYGSGTMGGAKAQAALDKHRQAAATPTPPPSQPAPPPSQPAPPPSQPAPPPARPTPPPSQPAPKPENPWVRPDPEKPGPGTYPSPSPAPQPQPQPQPQPTPQPTPQPAPGSAPGRSKPPKNYTPPANNPSPWHPGLEKGEDRTTLDVISDYVNWADGAFGGIGWSNYQNAPASEAALNHSGKFDTPESSYDFVSRYNDINNVMQQSNKSFQEDHAGNAMSRINNMGMDLVGMNDYINRSAQISRDRATIQASHLFGDQWKMKAPDWESGLGNQPDPYDPNLDEIRDESKDNIDDLF